MTNCFLTGGGRLALAGVGLDRQVHLLDHAAQDRGVDVVLLQDFGDLVDVNFGHGNGGYLCVLSRFLITSNCFGERSRLGTRRSASEISRFQSSSVGRCSSQE